MNTFVHDCNWSSWSIWMPNTNLEYNALLTKSSCFEEFLVFHQVYEARWGGRPRWLTFFSSLIWTWHGWVMLMYKTHVLADLLHACQFQHPFCVQSPFSACLDHGFWAFLMNMKKNECIEASWSIYLWDLVVQGGRKES